MKTTKEVCDAIEWDLIHQNQTVATTENDRSILERHVKPLVEWEVHYCPTGTDLSANIDACKRKAKLRGVAYIFVFNYDTICRVFPDGTHEWKKAAFTDKL